MAIKIVFANNKGGVGKTTSVLNLSSFLSMMGKRVLCMDFDSQANLTISFGIDIISLERSFGEVFLGKVSLVDAIMPLYSNLSIVPARTDLAKVASSDYITTHFRKNEVIKQKIGEVESDFDFIIMDTAPSKDILSVLTMNCLAFADYAIIPIQFEHFAVAGLSQMMDIIKDVKEQWLNPGLKLLGILGTFYQNTNNNRYHSEMIKNTEAGRFLFDTKIRRNTSLSASVSKGLPITLYDRTSNGYSDYYSFTIEMLNRIGVGYAVLSQNHAPGAQV